SSTTVRVGYRLGARRRHLVTDYRSRHCIPGPTRDFFTPSITGRIRSLAPSVRSALELFVTRILSVQESMA
ncbi:MAG TPA: hypothetical protein VKA37_02375, partial [Halobacteriales archaeon]|nr:hypothetical protein [Halobacteriales archaeon]